MSLIALNRLVRRGQRRLVMLLAATAIIAAVFAAHSALGEHHMAMGADKAAMICLAILAAAAVVLARPPLVPGRLLAPLLIAVRAPGPVRPAQGTPARAGPAGLQVFRC